MTPPPHLVVHGSAHILHDGRHLHYGCSTSFKLCRHSVAPADVGAHLHSHLFGFTWQRQHIQAAGESALENLPGKCVTVTPLLPSNSQECLLPSSVLQRWGRCCPWCGRPPRWPLWAREQTWRTDRCLSSPSLWSWSALGSQHTCMASSLGG